MEAIVLAGGFGTRLSHIVKDVPKPMADVAGRPFLEYILDDLIQQGITRIVLAVHYKKECIMSHFNDSYKGAEIIYSIENTPLLTGGAIKKACQFCSESSVWIINGDTFFQVDLKKMKAFAEEKQVPVSIAIKRMHHFSRYGRVEVSSTGIVNSFLEKTPCEDGYINGGIYYLQKDMLDEYPAKFSLENDCFPDIQPQNKIAAYYSDGYFIDIGVPEDYYRAQEYFKEVNNAT